MADVFPRKRAGAAPPSPPRPDGVISCRATNPLSLQDDLEKVFIDARQAKATTATRLFRNEELFNALRKVAMPAYFEQNAMRGRAFSFWSSGCSSGEEVYSLAMVANDEFAKRKIQPRIECFGTDINRDRLVEARGGVYNLPGKTSMSDAYWRMLSRYAQMDAREVRMGDTLRGQCRFGIFDMRNRPRTHIFDFVVCNHVLQYYDLDGQIHILRNLAAVLRQNGYLYLEGITEQSYQTVGFKKLAGHPNVFIPAGRRD